MRIILIVLLLLCGCHGDIREKAQSVNKTEIEYVTRQVERWEDPFLSELSEASGISVKRLKWHQEELEKCTTSQLVLVVGHKDAIEVMVEEFLESTLSSPYTREEYIRAELEARAVIEIIRHILKGRLA